MVASSEVLRAHIDKLLSGEQHYIMLRPGGALDVDKNPPKLILSGSFNPLHSGHVRLLEAASTRYPTAEAAFELSIVNADKPPLQIAEVLKRASQFTGRYLLLLTTVPTFVQKAALFPGACFVIGFDTAVRLLEPRYYSPASDHGVEAALERIHAAGCTFLVAGRVVNGRFQEATSFEPPARFASMFIPLPFRDDVSSTQLRQQMQREARL